jgi:predicted nucleic acid-binding protein
VIYLDTSCLIKLFRAEPSSGAVRASIMNEGEVIVSTIAELEMMVRLKAAWKAGDYTRAQWRKLESEFSLLRNQPPFDFRAVPTTLFRTALRQHRNSENIHCRSIDRLHLAAMEEFEISRLMTHDQAQADAAASLGFDIIQPGRA